MKRLLCLLTLLVLGLAFAGAQGTLTLSPPNADWRYFAADADPGPAWPQPAFNDAAWSNGVARLGFGGDGEATVIGSPTNRFVTYYFRRTFAVTNAAAITNLLARTKVDDGCVVYLNGAELFRTNVPSFKIDRDAEADVTISGAAENTPLFSLHSAAGRLVEGVNVLAAEVHQASPLSGDLGWEMELFGNVAGLPPTVTTVSPVAGQSVPAGAVTVTARVQGAVGVTLLSRSGGTVPTGPFTSIAMADDGAHGDGAAGDGLFGAAFLASGCRAEFMVQGISAAGVGSTSAPVVIVVQPPPGFPAIVINEALTHTDPPLEDAIELFNPMATNVAIGGWFLTDDFAAPRKFRIPDGTVISPGGFAVFYESQFNNAALGTNRFALGSAGEEVYLVAAGATSNLLGYCHGFRFGAAANGVSFGRYMNSVGEEQFVAMSARTLGAVNAAPLVGPVVISEIMFHPPDFSDGTDDQTLEFVEL